MVVSFVISFMCSTLVWNVHSDVSSSSSSSDMSAVIKNGKENSFSNPVLSKWLLLCVSHICVSSFTRAHFRLNWINKECYVNLTTLIAKYVVTDVMWDSHFMITGWLVSESTLVRLIKSPWLPGGGRNCCSWVHIGSSHNFIKLLETYMKNGIKIWIIYSN